MTKPLPSITGYHLDQVLVLLGGASREQLIVFNQWAAVALDLYHSDSNASYHFLLDGTEMLTKLSWDSNFEKSAMRARKDIAEDGAISLAFFVMAVLLDYTYVHQSEIGEGVDYGFHKNRPSSENFFKDCHYVEVSGLLEENKSNTLASRIMRKHGQIDRGSRRTERTSVIVTHFQKPITVKENH